MRSERTRPAGSPTGDPRVDRAIEGLTALDTVNLDDRPAVLEQVHDRLRELLGELPGEPGRRGQQAELEPGAAPGTGPRR